MKRRELIALLGSGFGVSALAASNSNQVIPSDDSKGQFVDVRAYGAVGDGVHDDYQALQRALNECSRSGRTLYLRSGRYKISKGLVIKYSTSSDWVPGFRIVGDAPGLSLGAEGLIGSVLLPTESVQGAVLAISGMASTDNSNKGQINGFVIENVGFNGGGYAVDGLYLSYFTNVTIRNVHIGFCRNGLVLSRQANGVSYGYGHALTIDRLFAVSNSGWGMLSVGEGAVSCVLIDPNFTENKAGGIKASGCPMVALGGGFFGNRGPAVLHGRASSKTDSFGPVFYGTRFESNGRESAGFNVVLDSPVCATFDACYFLCSTNGENGVFIAAKNSVDATVSLRGVKFSGANAKNQKALYCDRRTLPFDLGTCSFTGFASPIFVSDKSIFNLSVMAKLGGLNMDPISSESVDGLRIGRYLLTASDIGVASKRLL